MLLSIKIEVCILDANCRGVQAILLSPPFQAKLSLVIAKAGFLIGVIKAKSQLFFIDAGFSCYVMVYCFYCARSINYETVSLIYY